MDVQQKDDPPGDQEPSEPARVQLGKIFSGWRETLNRGQSWVAKKLGTNQSNISRWQRGETLPDPETIEKFWQIYAENAKSKPDDAELAQALALHKRAKAEPARIPQQEPGPTGDTQPPNSQPQQPKTKKVWWLRLGAAGAATLVATAVWAGVHYRDSESGDTTPPPPTAAPTATCDGVSCASLEPTTTTCAKDATTAYTGRNYGVLVELRYSARCHAVWAKMSGTSAGDRAMITPKEGHPEEYRQQNGPDAHTRMVPARIPADAQACAMVEGRGTVCATEPAPSTAASPRPTSMPGKQG
ncbi:DUF2690 domain-containing protein [Streptomyces sp. NPDC005407]|uniref:DUF2690 domain-containing protein n=1 Tax=Streptomyces sp. NPDC005407 TaxID=3155340 RepID=UPI0033AF3352